MRLPRDISGNELAKKLTRFGYHTSIRVDTLSAIINEIAGHLKMTKEQLIEVLFG